MTREQMIDEAVRRHGGSRLVNRPPGMTIMLKAATIRALFRQIRDLEEHKAAIRALTRPVRYEFFDA